MTHATLPFHLAVTSAALTAHRQVLLSVDAQGSGFFPTHTRVGQYALVRLPGEDKERPFVLASPPGANPLLFLIKANDDEELARLCALGGQCLALSAAAGPGFPLERAERRPLYLVAGGSAVAALRPVVTELLSGRARYGPVHLFYGVRRPDEVAFQAELAGWREGLGGLDIVVSEPEGTDWQGEVGLVHEALPDPLPQASRAIAFVCGPPPMEAAAKAALVARGVDPERIFRNY